MRQQLANVLKGVVAQRLIPSKDGKGRFPANEILIGTSIVRRHLLEGKMSELVRVIEKGEYYGMRSFDQDLLRLASEGKIDGKMVVEYSSNPEDAAIKLQSLSAQTDA